MKIYGIDNNGRVITGTCFILGKPISSNPSEKLSNYVLVTAKHVFRDVSSDFVFVDMRLRLNNDNEYWKYTYKVQIRDNGNKLWTEHENDSIDVAAMYFQMPDTIRKQFKKNFLSMNNLANDSLLNYFEIHPGDEIFCLGFPEGYSSNKYNFPLLRSGRIASYPILPSKVYKKFYYDVEVYGGNSGGPVYLLDKGRIYQGDYHKNESIFLILGLVSEQIVITDYKESDSEFSLLHNKPIKIATVVQAQFIREVINMLPENLDK